VTSWSYVYDTAGFDPLTATPVSTASDSVSLTGLNTSTSYDFYVQSDCGSNVGTWIGPLNFTTMVDAGTCGFFTVDLFDSFGDGWNGNGLIVSVNGVVYDTLTIASGNNATYLIPSDVGDVLDFDYVIDAYATGGNTWVSENSYTITSSSGNSVANVAYDAALATVPSTLGVVACPQNDLAIVAAVAPSGCDLAVETVEIWVVNEGNISESNFDVSYGVNGAAPTIETIAGPLAAGDTVMYVFTQTTDMSIDGIYNFASHVYLTNDSDTLDNNFLFDGENFVTPAAPTTIGDTICNGDTAMVSAPASDYAYWYDAATGGNLVGEGIDLNVSPSVTTSYFAESGIEVIGSATNDTCRSASRTEAVVTVEDCSNIIDLAFGDLRIYPNPNNGLFTITNSQEMTDVVITDLQGKIVYNRRNINLNKVNVELNDLERGMYMINIKTENDITSKTIVVQ
jgi:hypothetical protein